MKNGLVAGELSVHVSTLEQGTNSPQSARVAADVLLKSCPADWFGNRHA